MNNHLTFEAGSTAVLTFGEPLVAFVPATAGKLESVKDYHAVCAGAELNTAVGLARLQVPIAYAAAVGDDGFGTSLLRDLRAEGVDVTHVAAESGGTTGILFKQRFGRDEQTSVLYYRGLSPMGQGLWATDAVLAAVRSQAWGWVHSSGITWMLHEHTRKAANQLLAQSRANGVRVSFDLNVRLKLAEVTAWRALALEVAPAVTWFLLGDEEAQTVFGESSAVRIEQLLREGGFAGEGVVVKRGADGVEASCHGVVTQATAWPVSRVVDTVGAGDGFNAGFIAGMVRSWDFAQALRLGNLVGAYAVTSVGDCDGYPAWRDVVRDLAGEGGIMR